jgi:ribosomal protein L11 methyltransferase
MSATVRLAAAFPEARRIAEFLERDFADDGVAVSLFEGTDTWLVEAWFPENDRNDARSLVLDRIGTDGFDAPIQTEDVEDIDWMASSLRGLHPVHAGRFLIHGSHDRDIPRLGRVAIEIDAAQAFGTGHHATTAGCLVALEHHLRRRRPVNTLDLGTGSGVLAIALAKAARRPVLATDIDPLAVSTARTNAASNHVAPLVRIIEATGTHHPEIRSRSPYDLIVANILAGPLMLMAPDIAKILMPGGELILSGLLVNQRERVVAAYARQGITLRRAWRFEEWRVLSLARPSSRVLLR